MSLYIFLICLLISTSMFFETFGFILRVIGKLFNTPSLGYSFHVQLATITRFGTLISFPIIAYLIDSGIRTNDLLLLPVSIYLLLSIALYFFSKKSKFSIRFGMYVFRVLGKISSYSLSDEIKWNNLLEDKSKSQKVKEHKKILIFGSLAFVLTSASFLLSSIIASLIPEYRATILQSSPFLSSLGTLVSVMLFDPSVSKLIDNSAPNFSLIRAIWHARMIGSLIALSLFIILGLIIKSLQL